MPQSQLTALILLASFASSANAQYYYRRRSTTSIIAGAVVGGLALLFLICLTCMILRRARARRAYMANPNGRPPPTGFGMNPVFGGRWGGGGNTGFAQNNGPAGVNTYQPPMAQNTPLANTGHPNPVQNASAAPPAYGKDANYQGNYQPPSQPPPGSDNPYAAPPGPPPAAHTTGQGHDFVGGFR